MFNLIALDSVCMQNREMCREAQLMFKQIALSVIVFSTGAGMATYTLFQTYHLKMGAQTRLSGYQQTVHEASVILGFPDDEAKTFHEMLRERQEQARFLPPRLEAAAILGLPWSTPQEELAEKAFVVQQALDNESAFDARFCCHKHEGITFKMFNRVKGFMKPDEKSCLLP